MRLESAANTRIKYGFEWLDSHMPNLQSTSVNLFCGHGGRPTDRFLAYLLTAMKKLRGKKIITVHGTNRAKSIIAKQWRHRVRDSHALVVLGGCHCHAWASADHNYLPNWKRGQLSQADTLTSWFNNWTKGKAELAIQGAPIIQVNEECKGPLIGCLLCQMGTHCKHDRRYDPSKINAHALAVRDAAYLQQWSFTTDAEDGSARTCASLFTTVGSKRRAMASCRAQ